MIYVYAITLMIIGFVQVISALIRIAFAKRQSSTYAILLKRYILYVIIYFSILYVIVQFESIQNFLWLYLFLIPPFIALWYNSHINKWRQKHKRIREYDNQLLLNVPCKERLELDSLPKQKIRILKLKNGLMVKTASA